MKNWFRIMIIMVALLVWTINLFVESQGWDYDHEDETIAEEEVAILECDEYSEEDSVALLTTHHRSWEEYTKYVGYCSDIEVAYDDAAVSELERSEITVGYYIDDNDYWRQIYYRLYINDKDRFQGLQDSLHAIGRKYNLDRDDFARMVVSMVQDIPYQYVIPDECNGTEKSPCNPNVLFGIYSPVEFMYSMRGDCDTRTVFLYTLLRNFGYEPVIINSNEYAHSMLALDIPSSGDDFEYKGKRYAFWETTNIRWLPGMLPPDMSNKNYWSVALDYEFEDNTAGGY